MTEQLSLTVGSDQKKREKSFKNFYMADFVCLHT